MVKEVARINTHTTDIVDCDPNEYWEMLVNRWEDFKYWLTAGGQELAMVSSTLAAGSKRGVFPRTRIIHLDNPEEPTGIHFLQETIFYANPQTRTMFYRVDGIGNMYLRNYIAVQTIDEVEPGKCRITISSHFDTLPEYAEAAEGATKWFHDTIIHRGAENATLIAAKERDEAKRK